MDELLRKKEAALGALLRSYGSVAVAFSGGVDSTLLLDVAHEVLGEEALAITACFACNPQREQQAARRFCKERGIRHLELAFDEFSVPGFAENPPNRCYLCKRALLGKLWSAAHTQGAATLAEGSNLDDESDYRPGLVAVEELQVASPLRATGLSKADIRALAHKRGLAVWDKPACACLATRLPYGSLLNPELISRIDKAEEQVLALGAKQVRVRVHDERARIEVDKESIPLFEDQTTWTTLTHHLNELGFTLVELDPEGYRTGNSMRP